MASAKQSINVNASPEKIWGLLKDPNNWSNWFEGASQPKSINGDGNVGTEVEITMTVANISLPTKLTITEMVQGEKWKGEFESPGLATGFMIWSYMNMGPRTKLTFHIQSDLKGPAKLAEGMVVPGFEEMAQKTLLNVKAMAEG